MAHLPMGQMAGSFWAGRCASTRWISLNVYPVHVTWIGLSGRFAHDALAGIDQHTGIGWNGNRIHLRIGRCQLVPLSVQHADREAIRAARGRTGELGSI